jgi:hypothetical protein
MFESYLGEALPQQIPAIGVPPAKAGPTAPALPTPEQQGANLAKFIEQLQQRGVQEPAHDPSVSTTPTEEKSKLPLILGGVVLVAVGAALWWRFK